MVDRLNEVADKERERKLVASVRGGGKWPFRPLAFERDLCPRVLFCS
jgi:hypothetical protein